MVLAFVRLPRSVFSLQWRRGSDPGELHPGSRSERGCPDQMLSHVNLQVKGQPASAALRARSPCDHTCASSAQLRSGTLRQVLGAVWPLPRGRSAWRPEQNTSNQTMDRTGPGTNYSNQPPYCMFQSLVPIILCVLPGATMSVKPCCVFRPSSDVW